MRDQIYTVHNIHDGRRIEGIANFEGDPHHFECEFDDEADEWSEVYRLTPISPATLRLELESWQIWLRWGAAFRAGQPSLDTHPALPNERARYDELRESIRQAIKEAQTGTFRATAKFLPDETVEWSRAKKESC